MLCYNNGKKCRSYLIQKMFSITRDVFFILFIHHSFVMSDIIKTNESDVNYTLYYDSYQNISLQDSNISILNDTSVDISTELESTISVTEDSDTPLQNRELLVFLTPDEDICNCDLTASFCDVNCCCDQDCREEDVQIFSECTHQSLTPDENYCYQKNIILRNNTIYKMVKNLDDPMFCIVHDNFKHRLHYRDMPVLKSHRDVITVLNYKYKNTYSWDAKSENVYDSREPRAGNPIYISSKQHTNSPWSLPSPCLSDICSCNEQVRYLMDFHSSCSHVVLDLESECESNDILSGDMFADFCIGRHSVATSLTDLIAHTKIVDSNNSSSEAEEYDTLLCVKNERRPRKMSSRKICENIVSHIHFVVEQDGSNGITKISADFQYDSISYGQQVMVLQSYRVDFVWSNITEFEKKSGNPGYQVGLPVLAATNGSDLNSDEMSKVFYKDGLTILSGDSEGFCARHRQTVKFGKNLRSGCILKHNFTNCKNLHNSIAELLLGPNQQQIFVGIFGNANVSNPNDWLEVFHGTEDLTNDQDCSVSTGLLIHVIYAAVGTFVNPQYKIVGVRYLYSKREVVEASAVTLSTSVSFFDVTLPAVEHYAKVPSIKANLPGDFFYPFLYGQTVKTVSSQYLMFVLIVCFCIFERTI